MELRSLLGRVLRMYPLLMSLLVNALFASLMVPLSAQQQEITRSAAENTAITISGEVVNPMRLNIRRRGAIRLLEVLALAEGITDRAKGIIQINRRKEGQRTAGESAAPSISTYQISDLLKGDRGADPYVWPGDEIVVPAADYFYIEGRVLNPGHYLMKEPLTIGQAIRMAGGASADAQEVNVLLCSRSKSNAGVEWRSFKLTGLWRKRAKGIYLGNNDIVQVRSRSHEIIRHLLGCMTPQETTKQLPVREIY